MKTKMSWVSKGKDPQGKLSVVGLKESVSEKLGISAEGS